MGSPENAGATADGVRVVASDRGIGYAKCSKSGVLRRLGLVAKPYRSQRRPVCYSEGALPVKPQFSWFILLSHGAEVTA